MRRLVCLLVCLFFFVAACSVPVLASSASSGSSADSVTYVMTGDEMAAFLSTCTATARLQNGSQYSVSFVRSASSDFSGYYVLNFSTQGGPGSVCLFDLSLSLDIRASSVVVHHFCTNVYYPQPGSNPSVNTPLSLNCSFNGVLPSSSDVYTDSLPVGNVSGASRVLCRVQDATFQFDDVNQLNSFQASFSSDFGINYGNDFYYGIQSISYTASAAVVDNLQQAIAAIIANDNANTVKIIENHNAKVAEIIENQNQNAQDIIDNQDKNTQEIIENQDKNHQEQLEHDQQLWTDTYDPDLEQVDDLASAIFDESVQDALKSKLGLFTFLHETLIQLLDVFDDPGDSSTALVMPALVVPIDGVDYEIISETPFDMAETLDQIPVLVSAIRFVSGIVIIFGFIGYLQRLKIRFFGGG